MTKRTYELDDDTIEIIDRLGDDNRIPFNKSQMVQRAVKYYWKDMEEGQLQDAVVASALNGDTPEGSDEDDDDSTGLLGRFR
jgi:hypothetical protein